MREVDQVQGGVVWDWADQSLARGRAAEGDRPPRWYDGDPSLLNGLVSADSDVRSTLEHAKACQRPIDVERMNGRTRTCESRIATCSPTATPSTSRGDWRRTVA